MSRRWSPRTRGTVPSGARRAASGDGGAASVLLVALMGLVLLLGLAASFVTATVAAHRRAQAAADLAALAGAVALGRGEDPCGAAARVATANGASLGGCLVDGRDVLVDVSVSGPRYLGHGWEPGGSARAGPGRP